MLKLKTQTYAPRGNLRSPYFLFSDANFDEDAIERPETFDIQCENTPHLALGYGTYFCLGAHLSKLEKQIFFKTLIERLSDLCLIPEKTAQLMAPSVVGCSHCPWPFEEIVFVIEEKKYEHQD